MDPKNIKNAFALVNRLKKDRWRNPEQKMTGTQRVRAALGERFEQATLGQMGMLGRGIMAARRGEKAPFRRMLTSEIQRRIENTGPIGQALVAHAQAKRYQQMMEKQQLINQTIAKQTAVIEQQQQHAEKQQQVISNNITIVGKALYQIDQRLEDIVLSQRNINHLLNKNRYGVNASKPANDNRIGIVAVNDNLSKDPRRNPKQKQNESSILSGLTSLISTAVSTGLAAVFARFGLPIAGRLGTGIIGRGATAALGRYLPPAAAATAGTALGTFGADFLGGVASGNPAAGIGTALSKGAAEAYRSGYTPGGLIKRWFGKKPTTGIGGYPAAKSQTQTEQHMRLKDFERAEANKQNQPDNVIKVVASQEMLFETLSSAPISFKANKIIFDAPNIVFGNQQAPSTSTPSQAVPQQAIPQQQTPSAPAVPGIPGMPGAPLPNAIPQPGTTRRRSGPADRYTPSLPDSVKPVVPGQTSTPEVGPTAEGGHPLIAQERAQFFDELEKNPALKDKILNLMMHENARHPIGPLESLMNRSAARVHKGEYKSMHDMIHGGFYGPINRGQVGPRITDPKKLAKAIEAYNRVRGGSNEIDLRTDQGMENEHRFADQNPAIGRKKQIGGEWYSMHNRGDYNWYQQMQRRIQEYDRNRPAQEQPPVGNTPAPIPSDLSKATPQQMRAALYDTFRAKGISHTGAIALTGEVGRENGYNPDLIFGSHTDPANRRTNAGIISWQKERRNKLMAHLKTSGQLDEKGNIKRTPDALSAQADFLLKEMESGEHGSPTQAARTRQLLEKMRTGEVDIDQAHQILGRDFIRWTMDALPSHYKKMRGYDKLTEQEVASRPKGAPPLMDRPAIMRPGEAIKPDLPQIMPNVFNQFPIMPQAIPSEPIIMGMPAPTQQGQPISTTTQLNGNPSGPLSPIQPPAATDVPLAQAVSCVPADDDFNTADRGGCKPIVDKNSETVGNKPGTPQPQSDWQ